MNFRIVCQFLGKISLAESAVMLLPLALALVLGEDAAVAFFGAAAGCFGTALVLLRRGQVRKRLLTMREGIAITGLGWLLATGLGMLPYVLSGHLVLLDGVFESISGFTGTGATVIDDLEVLPQSLLLWRSMTHWLGGLGIVVIFIALLPESGQDSSYIYNAEAAGPTKERVLPRLREMTQVLFQLYMAFTVIALAVFIGYGMDLISAVNHALSTISAGGFSTYNESAAHFESPAIEGWMTFFMILAGGNFGLYYRVYQKGFAVLRRNTEFKAYLTILGVSTCLVVINLMMSLAISLPEALRFASFQVASIATTGFVSADYDLWPPFSKGVLLLLMLCGGCAGSTAAGLKVSRLVILVRTAWAAAVHAAFPKRLAAVTMNGCEIDGSTVIRVGQFFFLYMVFIAFWAALLTFDGIAGFDAIGISITTMGCIGPAFGVTGATCTYAELSSFSKMILCLSMLVGRLEIFTVLVMLRPGFWRKKGNW
ncbi:TrkH family potassium uptake protein [Megasphaera vaginalis (ex Srinivasan et al. 2021)]|uniref:Cation transport protein n=1 Tax=Megasphaera vaginalis (ex Srinivasan et al. 2021) TaxID=1111454 RepID=U7URK2_9FIRM|nr:TrkH family potassium uptake protein [Megasphaera vaginalis (ex Srinivasan et al. 2021)]ERT61916.1 cation transport protein [Megasphaera vaginalis (ex Srinivasan et al. 2021)]